MKYYTSDDVIARMRDETDLVDVDTQLPRVRRLIMEAAIGSLTAESFKVEYSVDVPVNNGIAAAPCGMIRLLRSFDGTTGKPVSVRNDTVVLKPADINVRSLRVVYYGLPTVERNGMQEPAIMYAQIQYCALYVICKLLRDDYARGKIPSDVLARFEQERDLAYNKALTDTYRVSIDDMERNLWFMRNAQFIRPR